MNNFMNPKRESALKINKSIFFQIKINIVKFLCSLGFKNYDFSHVNGEITRIKFGKNISTTNTLFNTVSGTITIGDDTIFGHDCMLLTGRHRFFNGKRAKLVPNSEHFRETPESGYNIEIGSGCFIASGVIITAPVKIGDNVLIGAGSVVTTDLPSNCFAAGVPAKVLKFHY